MSRAELQISLAVLPSSLSPVLKAGALAPFLDIHGGVGLMDHLFKIVQGVRIAADDADAHRELRLTGVAEVLVGDVAIEALFNLDGGRGGACGEDDEFIASHAAQNVGVAEALAKDFGGRDNQAIAGVVALAIVHFFEAVEIDVDEPSVSV